MKRIVSKIALVALVATVVAPVRAISFSPSNGVSTTFNSKTGTFLLGATAVSALLAGGIAAATYFRKRGGSMAEGILDALGVYATAVTATPGVLSLGTFAGLCVYNSFGK